MGVSLATGSHSSSKVGGERSVACTLGKLLPIPESAQSTVCGSTSSHWSHSFSQQIARWVSLLLGHGPSPHSFCAEGFSSPNPTGKCKPANVSPLILLLHSF
jgi:hypothetical protein